MMYLGMTLEEVKALVGTLEQGSLDEDGDYTVYIPSYWTCDVMLEFENGVCVAYDDEGDED